MNYYKLTVDEYQAVTFWADSHRLKSRLNSAFIDFKKKHGLNHALLYVRHRMHGWRQVCGPNNTYLIIDSPLTLDHGVLALAVTYTLAQADHLPTVEQQQEKKKKYLQAERLLNAEIKRNTFHIVKDDDKTP